jgi:drug/metabolite transporter (DMT)-like permease
MGSSIFAWITSILFGVEAITGKLTSRHSVKNPWLFNFFWAFFILLFTIPFAIWGGADVPKQWGNIIIASVFYAAASTFYILALYKLDVSIIGSLFNFRTVVTVILGALFLGEILSIQQYVLIGIIFIFGILITVDEKFSIKSFFKWGVFIALLGVSSSALMAMFIKRAVAEAGYWDTTLWMAVLGQIWLLPTILLFKKDIAQSMPKQYLIIAATAVAGVFGTLAMNKAYSINVSISSAIISLPFSLVMAILFSVFAPQLLEKHTFKVYAVRVVSAAVMIVAALNL